MSRAVPFIWINIRSGFIGLHGYPIQIRRNHASEEAMYTLIALGQETGYGFLKSAKWAGESRAAELEELGLI